MKFDKILSRLATAGKYSSMLQNYSSMNKLQKTESWLDLFTQGVNATSRYLAKHPEVISRSTGQLSKKVKKITYVQKVIDSIDNPKLKQKVFDSLPKDTQDTLDTLYDKMYSDKGRKNIPLSGGHWTGEPGNSEWIPDSDTKPSNKGYSNIQGKTWGQIREENGVSSIKFKDGRVDFSSISEASVRFDWEKTIGTEKFEKMLKTGNRQYLHDAAFAKLAENLHCSIEDVIRYKNKKNLVWHEEPDCQTLRLVPREIHDNVKHFGGVSMASVVKGKQKE